MFEHRILVAGGGVGGLEAVLALRALGGPRVSPVLVSPQADFGFRALQVTEPFAAEEPTRFAVADVLAGLDVPQIRDVIVRVDTEQRRAFTARGESLGYDALLLALGGTPYPVYANGITFDRPGDPGPFEELLADVEAGLASEVVFVIPDTRGWSLPAYDLALLLRGWSRRKDVPVGIRVVTAETAPLQAFGPGVAAEVRAVLDRAEVSVVAGSSPVVVSDGALLAGSHWLTADRIVSLPGLAGPRLPGVPCDGDGFLLAGPHGAVPGCPGVYAVGDGAAHPRKQGGLAAQQADGAARAILRAVGVPVPPEPEDGVLRGALATPEGPLFLQSASGYGQAGSGSIATFVPLWDPPTKVATRWLGPHLEGLGLRRTRAFAA